jgi:hypothetical protein
VCDGIDRDCAVNLPIQGVPCIGAGAGSTCLIGTTECDDETGISPACALDPDADARVPDAACACADLIGTRLVECLRDHATEVQCDIELRSISPILFCPSNAALTSPVLWFHDTGTVVGAGGSAAWWAPPQQPHYGWMESNQVFSSGVTSGAWPPSPAVSLEGGAPANFDGRRDDLLMVYRSPVGVIGLNLVEVNFDLTMTCDPDPDCDLAFPP